MDPYPEDIQPIILDFITDYYGDIEGTCQQCRVSGLIIDSKTDFTIWEYSNGRCREKAVCSEKCVEAHGRWVARCDAETKRYFIATD